MLKQKSLLLLLFILLCILTSPVLAERPHPKDYYGWPVNEAQGSTYISKEIMLADIAYYIAKVKDVHPNPYRFTSEAEFTHKVAEIEQKIAALPDENFTIMDFYYYALEISALIQDEHTTIDRPHAPLQHIYPHSIQIVDGRIYKPEGWGSEVIPSGAEILAINGLPAETIVQEMLKFQNQSLTPRKIRTMQNNFWGYFDQYFKFVPPYQVKYNYNGQIVETILEEYIPNAESNSTNNTTENKPYRAGKVEINGHLVPYLRVDSFSSFNYNVSEYQEFVDDFFAKNHDKPYLIIDIRNNPGGDSGNGYYVLSYLTDKPYKTFEQMTYKASDLAKQKMTYSIHNTYYNMKIPRFLWGLPLYKLTADGRDADKVLKAQTGALVETGPFVEKPFKTRYRFTGTAYLLISENTGSAAIDTAAAFKYNQLGVTIGSETAHPDSYCGNKLSFQLPHSKLLVGMPTSFSISAKGYDDRRGVLPDVTVTSAITPGVDPFIETLKGLIPNKD